MNRVLAIAWGPGEARGVLFEDDRAVALLVERAEGGSLVGAVFLGRIQRILPSLPGAFVEIGLDRPAFLPGETDLTEGARLVVQVVKDARAEKPPEVTASLSLAGSLAVWTPQRPGLAVSRQIDGAERARLSELAIPLVEAGEGVVLRTHAAGASKTALAADIARLRADHAALAAKAEAARGPGRLDAVLGPVERLLARFDGTMLDRVEIDDDAAGRTARARFAGPVETVSDLAERHGMDDLFDEALGARVALQGGAEIVIESTAAATLIDVNLAAAASGRARAAETILAVNRAAALEVARQLRLRNIGGAVVVDFVSMTGKQHRQIVESVLREAVAGDSSPVELLGWTRLGHVELTRRRRAAALAEILLRPGPADGAKTPETLACEILRRIARAPIRPGPIIVGLDPAVEAVLQGALAESLTLAKARAGRPVIVEPRAGLAGRYDLDGI